MTARQRRDLLRTELGDLVVLVASYGKHPSSVENPFLDQLIEQMEEKRAELDALNAYVNSSRYRFWEESNSSRFLIWIAFAVLLFALPMAALMKMGWITTLFLVAVILCLAWGVWAGKEPQP